MRPTPPDSDSLASPCGVVLIESRFGWVGLLGDEAGVRRVVIGHASRADLLDQLLPRSTNITDPFVPAALKEAADRIDHYLGGEPVDLTTIPLHLPRCTPFQQQVVAQLRQVGYGETLSYGELAARAGRPRAARAVGTVMSSNPLPLLIPCHRVVGAGGQLGGFSAPTGIALKRQLLEMEQCQRPSAATDLVVGRYSTMTAAT
ncbi:MAG: methylated-DNA--[protein]-cysteine S-methyltransferase [Planctomycetaceae bacterium]